MNVRNVDQVREHKLSTFADRCIKNVLLPSAPDFNQSLFVFIQIIRIIEMSLVYTLLFDAPNFVVDWVQVGDVWRPQIRAMKTEVSRCSS